MRTALGIAGGPGLTRALAAGYHGPPELTVTRALTEWTLDPWMLVLIVLLGGGYLAGVRRVWATGTRGDWPAARPIWFCGLGLGFLLIATMSWVGVYQSVLMYPRAVQTVLLVLVVPLFLALGRPLTLLATVYPPNQTASVYLADAAEVCAQPVQTLFISAVQAGSGGT